MRFDYGCVRRVFIFQCFGGVFDASKNLTKSRKKLTIWKNLSSWDKHASLKEEKKGKDACDAHWLECVRRARALGQKQSFLAIFRLATLSFLQHFGHFGVFNAAFGKRISRAWNTNPTLRSSLNVIVTLKHVKK